MKTIFLVALATANRVGEIQALSNQVGFLRDGSVMLSFESKFLAKNESHRLAVNRDFKIPALSSITDDREEILLCPARAVKYYLKLTACQGRAKNLFVSPRDPTRPLSKNACSAFLKEAIKKAYENVSDGNRALTKVNAHEIRGEEFQRQQQNSWQDIQDLPLELCIRQNGENSKIGVVNGRSILSMPL